MLKTFFASCLIGCITAELIHETVKPIKSLEPVTDGNFVSSGEIGEWYGESMDDEGNYWNELYFWMQWTTEGNFPAGSWVQNYAQWQDEENPGKYYAVTCNAQVIPTETVSPDVKIHSLYGESIDVSAETPKKYHDIGTHTDKFEWGPCGDPDYDGCYATKVSEGSVSQTCTSVLNLKTEHNGETYTLFDLTHKDLQSKDIEVWTGFRVWVDEKKRSNVLAERNAGSTLYRHLDWEGEIFRPHAESASSSLEMILDWSEINGAQLVSVSAVSFLATVLLLD